MNKNFKNRQKSQFLPIISITFISLIAYLLFSIFTPATANSLSLTPDCTEQQNCIVIAQVEPENNINEVNKSSAKTITPASQQAELIAQARKFYGGNSFSSLATILFMTIGPLKIVPTFVKLTVQSDPDVIKKLVQFLADQWS